MRLVIHLGRARLSLLSPYQYHYLSDVLHTMGLGNMWLLFQNRFVKYRQKWLTTIVVDMHGLSLEHVHVLATSNTLHRRKEKKKKKLFTTQNIIREKVQINNF